MSWRPLLRDAGSVGKGMVGRRHATGGCFLLPSLLHAPCSPLSLPTEGHEPLGDRPVAGSSVSVEISQRGGERSQEGAISRQGTSVLSSSHLGQTWLWPRENQQTREGRVQGVSPEPPRRHPALLPTPPLHPQPCGLCLQKQDSKEAFSQHQAPHHGQLGEEPPAVLLSAGSQAGCAATV